jgi:predicted Fe-Mo cluster-binding NifX family protein
MRINPVRIAFPMSKNRLMEPLKPHFGRAFTFRAKGCMSIIKCNNMQSIIAPLIEFVNVEN